MRECFCGESFSGCLLPQVFEEGLLLFAGLGAGFCGVDGCPRPYRELCEFISRRDWNCRLGEGVWRSAGRAFQCYVERRHKQRDSGSRRILADFLVGARAQTRSYRLLTLDGRLYKAVFPTLTIETI